MTPAQCEKTLREGPTLPTKKRSAAFAEDEGSVTDEEEMSEEDKDKDRKARADKKKAPRWTINEGARTILCFTHTDVRGIVDAMMTSKSRELQDDKSIVPIWTQFMVIFNAPDRFFEHPLPTCSICGHLDPNGHVAGRDESTVRTKWAKIKSAYTVVYILWDVSGRGVEGERAAIPIANFFDRAGTPQCLRAQLVLMHTAIRGDVDLLSFGSRAIAPSAAWESGMARQGSAKVAKKSDRQPRRAAHRVRRGRVIARSSCSHG